VTAAVIDASLAVDLLTRRGDLRKQILDPYSTHHAPSHIDIECISALRGMLLGRRLSSDDFVGIAAAVTVMPITRHPLDPLVPRILGLAHNATPYDAAYIALAEALDADLLTTDAAMASIPGITCRVRVL
jgi:predicted nucleic acid-binding protein